MDTFFEHYREILSDPAHTAVELTFTLIVDVLVLGLLWPLVRRFIDRRLHREHELLDTEHGVTHPVGAEASLLDSSVPTEGGHR